MQNSATYSERLRTAIRGWRLASRQEAMLFILPAGIATLFLLGFPLLYTVWLSLHRWYGSHTDPMKWMGLRNYADILLRDNNFHRSFLITLVFTASTVIGSVVIGLCLALLLNRQFRGQNLVLALLMIPVVSTPVAISTTWRYILQYEGVFNAITRSLHLGSFAWLGPGLVIPSLVLVDVTRWVPLVTLIVLAGLSSLPSEPYEAAMMDGASTLQLIWYITLPLVRPYVQVAALIRLIDAIKIFDQVLVISGGGPAGASETLYMYGYKVAFSYLTFGYVSAVLILLFLIVLLASMAIIKLRRAPW